MLKIKDANFVGETKKKRNSVAFDSLKFTLFEKSMSKQQNY